MVGADTADRLTSEYRSLRGRMRLYARPRGTLPALGNAVPSQLANGGAKANAPDRDTRHAARPCRNVDAPNLLP